MGRAEGKIEDYLVERAQKEGAIVRKVQYVGRNGACDRWLFFPQGDLLIVEVKAPGEKPRGDQIDEMTLLRGQGFFVAWADTRAKVDTLLSNFSEFYITDFNERWPL